MSIDRLGSELEGLGVSGHDVRCSLLLPQVYVGWASARRQVAALEALLDTSAHAAQLDPAAVALVRGWLFDEPTRAQFQSGFALLRALRHAPDGSAVGSSDVLQAVLWAARAAQLDREAVGGGVGAISPGAWRALADVQAWLEVDVGSVLADLLTEDENAVVRPTRFDGLSELELDRGTALLDAAVMPVEELSDADVLAEEEPSGVMARATEPANTPFLLVRRVAS